MDEKQRILNRLQASSDRSLCGDYLAQCDYLHRSEIYNLLLFNRMKRKLDDLTKRYYYSCREDWNETLYTMLLRYMGAPANSMAFEKLASTAEYKYIRRHVNSISQLEALIIGTSGLLDEYCNDEYTLDLKREYEYLSRKYGISKMDSSIWQITNINPYNHPIIRMSQIAALVARSDMDIETLIKCRTAADAEKFFTAQASSYWTDHFIPKQTAPKIVKRIGSAKATILAINITVPLQYAYGNYTRNDNLRNEAINLLEELPPESNFKIKAWQSCGVIAHSAYDTQSLIQLTDEYCEQRKCSECPVGMRILYKAGVL